MEPAIDYTSQLVESDPDRPFAPAISRSLLSPITSYLLGMNDSYFIKSFLLKTTRLSEGTHFTFNDKEKHMTVRDLDYLENAVSDIESISGGRDCSYGGLTYSPGSLLKQEGVIQQCKDDGTWTKA